MRKVNILFTSVGRRVELLRAFFRAYLELGLEGKIVALDIDWLAPALKLADRPYIVPQIGSPNYVSTLVNICRREKIGLIFPLIDPDIPVLAHHKKVIESTGARLAVVSCESSATVEDKWLTCLFFQKIGLHIPRSWLPGELDPEQVKYPLFVKPRHGSAGKHSFKVHTAKELKLFLDYVPNPIIQEYLSGPEITNDVICDLDGVLLAIVSRQRIEVRWGEVAKGVTIHNSVIIDACVKIARALPAIGPITVQCIMNNGTPYFTEINARLGGGVPLGIAAGVDAPKWLLARTAGLSMEVPPLGTYQTGLYMTRFDDSFFITEEKYEQMASHRF